MRTIENEEKRNRAKQTVEKKNRTMMVEEERRDAKVKSKVEIQYDEHRINFGNRGSDSNETE